MTEKEKSALIAEVISLLELKLRADAEKAKENPEPLQHVEMLTIKECTKAVKGLSEHTVRQLVNQEKIPFIRTGEGKNGKILISKTALLNYLNLN